MDRVKGTWKAINMESTRSMKCLGGKDSSITSFCDSESRGMSVEVSVMEMEQQPQVVSSNLFQLNQLKDSRMTKKVTNPVWSVIDLERKL